MSPNRHVSELSMMMTQMMYVIFDVVTLLSYISPKM